MKKTQILNGCETFAFKYTSLFETTFVMTGRCECDRIHFRSFKIR